MNLSELQIYLPKYLSSDSENELFSGLKDFPSNIGENVYTNFLKNEPIVFQGDCLKELPIVNIQTLEKKLVNSIILSNTCDIDPQNKRNFPSNIIFAPIVKLADYKNTLLTAEILSTDKINTHIESIRKQRITQIFYFPSYSKKFEESILFFDRIFNIPNSYIDRDKLLNKRVFSLSDYGAYMFIYKISMHFTRIQDKVERKSIKI